MPRNFYLICVGLMFIFAFISLIQRNLNAAREYVITGLLLAIMTKLEGRM